MQPIKQIKNNKNKSKGKRELNYIKYNYKNPLFERHNKQRDNKEDMLKSFVK